MIRVTVLLTEVYKVYQKVQVFLEGKSPFNSCSKERVLGYNITASCQT